MSQFTYQCRSCGATRAITPAQLEAARRGLEQLTDAEAELAELLVAGDRVVAAKFECCPACRPL